MPNLNVSKKDIQTPREISGKQQQQHAVACYQFPLVASQGPLGMPGTVR